MRTAYSRLHSTGLYAVQQARGPKAQMASKSQNSPPKAQGLPKRKVQSAHIRQGARVKQSSKPMPTEVVSLGWGKVYPNGTFFRSRERSKTHSTKTFKPRKMTRTRSREEQDVARRLRRRSLLRRAATQTLPLGTRVRALCHSSSERGAPKLWYLGTIALDGADYHRDRKQFAAWDGGAGDWIDRTDILSGWVRMWSKDIFYLMLFELKHRGVGPADSKKVMRCVAAFCS